MLKKVFILLGLLILAAGAWVLWNRPVAVNMLTYAPADSMVYIEIPDVAAALEQGVNTAAWKQLATSAGVNPDLTRVVNQRAGRRWCALTGLCADGAVVLSRMQVAGVISGFTEEETDTTLKIRPRFALIIESHTGTGRLRKVVERYGGDLARRVIGETSFEVQPAQNAKPELLVWKAADGRQMFATLNDTTAIISNDATTLLNCLAVQRGERPALSTDTGAAKTLERVNADEAAMYAYASGPGAVKLAEVSTAAYTRRLVTNPELQAVLARTLPPLFAKFVSSAAWSTRSEANVLSDRYFVAMPSNVAQKFTPTLSGQSPDRTTVERLLGLTPPTTKQFTLYAPADVDQAWRTFTNGISAQLDVMVKILVDKLHLFDALLQSYGVDAPTFLQAIKGPVATVRVGDEAPVLVAPVRDQPTLETLIKNRLRLPQTTQPQPLGKGQIYTATDGQEAAAFVEATLVFGQPNAVRACVMANSEKTGLPNNPSNLQLVNSGGDNYTTLTLTDDRQATADFISLLGTRRLEAAEVKTNPLSLTLTRLESDGLTRQVTSNFGLVGDLAVQFADR